MNFYTNDQSSLLRQSLRDDLQPHEENLIKSRTFNHDQDRDEQLIID
jgi:hypothetical protein